MRSWPAPLSARVLHQVPQAEVAVARHPVQPSDGRGMTRACSGPMQAATAAAAPQAASNQNTLLWCSTRRTSSGGTSVSVQTVSLTKALLPRPSAKNEYRQLSCSSRPGRIRPSARKASRGAAVQQGRRDQRARAGHQPGHQRGPGGPRGGPPPGGQVGAAEPDQQRVGGQAARGGERERVGHVGQAERAELGRAQLAGDVEAHRSVAHAAHRLVGQSPAEPLGDPARERPDLDGNTASHG